MFLIKTLIRDQKKRLLKGFTIFFLFTLSACGNDIEREKIFKKPILPKPESFPKKSLGALKSHHVTEETRKTYQWYCAQCHGIEGKGNGINSKYVTVAPLNHTKPDYLETRTDQQLFNAIKFGGLKVGRAPCMPAWGHTLTQEMIWSLVRYIRELCHCEAV